MAILFKRSGNKVIPADEILLIPVFKTIWERDETPTKEMAHKEFAYIEFTSSLKLSNPYKGYTDEERDIIIRKDFNIPKSWKPDKLVMEGIEKMIDIQTRGSKSYSYYQSVLKAVESLKDFLNEVDLTERNPKTGNLILKPSEVTRALSSTDTILKNLKNLETKVHEDIIDLDNKFKADKKVSPLANPSTL